MACCCCCSLQVCLVALQLRGDGFEAFRCDRNVTLGIQLANFSKLLKCAGAAMRQQHFI
jgi:proliferating cell nuclear antigen